MYVVLCLECGVAKFSGNVVLGNVVLGQSKGLQGGRSLFFKPFFSGGGGGGGHLGGSIPPPYGGGLGNIFQGKSGQKQAQFFFRRLRRL